MRVLVTGATGFLGRHVVAELRAAGATPIAGVHRAEPRVDLRCERVQLAVEDAASIRSALGDAHPDAIVHCAAYGVDHREQDLLAAVSVNIAGSLQLYAAAREAGVERFVHVGTAYEYGDHPGAIDEATPLIPEGLYGASKAAAGIMLLERGRRYGCPPLIARPFSMYGPGEGRHKLVPQIIAASVCHAELALTEGHELRDYLPVADVARALAALACLETARFPFGATFNLCSGRAVSVRALAEAVADAAGGVATLRFGASPSRTDAPRSVVGDPTRWRAFCGAHELERVLVETPLAAVVTAMLAEEPTCES